MKRINKKRKAGFWRKATPAAIIGIVIGLMIAGAGVYGAYATGELTAYISAGLGFSLIALVVWIALIRG